MTTFPRKFIALVAVDAVSIMTAAALVMRGLLRPAMAIMAVLFIVNVFLGPPSLRERGADNRWSNRGRSKVWFLGFALLIAALVRSVLFLQSGFSGPALVGVIAAFLLGTLFLWIAWKSKEMNDLGE